MVLPCFATEGRFLDQPSTQIPGCQDHSSSPMIWVGKSKVRSPYGSLCYLGAVEVVGRMNCFVGLLDYDRMKRLRIKGNDRRTSSFSKQAKISNFVIKKNENESSSKPGKVTRIKELG